MNTRRRLLIAGIIILVAAFALTPPAMHFLGQELVNDLQDRGARIRVDGLEGRRIGLSAEAIEAWLSVPVGKRNRFLPVSLKFEDATATVSARWLSPWAPQVVFHGTSYGGRVAGALPLLSALAELPTLQLSVKGVDLSMHPQARAFGVEAGTIDAQADNHPIAGLPRDEARYSVDLRNLTVTLPPMVAQVVKISSLTETSLSAKAVVKTTGNFALEPCTLKSSLGSVELTARGVWSGESVRDLWGTLHLDLNTEQGALVRPWLGLLVPKARLSAEGPVECDFRGAPCADSAGTQLQLGPVCVRLECRS